MNDRKESVGGGRVVEAVVMELGYGADGYEIATTKPSTTATIGYDEKISLGSLGPL